MERHDRLGEVRRVLEAWRRGDHVPDDKLWMTIEMVEETVDVMQGLGMGDTFLIGPIMTLNSMRSAYRNRQISKAVAG